MNNNYEKGLTAPHEEGLTAPHAFALFRIVILQDRMDYPGQSKAMLPRFKEM